MVCVLTLSAQSVEKDLDAEEVGTLLIYGLWVYVKLPDGLWMEADIKNQATSEQLARFITPTRESPKREWSLY